jgi:hypothetical protein
MIHYKLIQSKNIKATIQVAILIYVLIITTKSLVNIRVTNITQLVTTLY